MENNFGAKPVTIEQHNRYIVLNLPTGQQQDPPYFSGKPFNWKKPDRITLTAALAGRPAYTDNYLLVGPLSPVMAYLHRMHGYTQSFVSEGNYLFNISQGLIKQKQLPYGKYAFRSHLSQESRRPYFKDYVLTARDIDSLWQDYLDHRNASEDLFRNQPLNKNGNGQLCIGSPVDGQGQPHFTTSVILFRYDDPDFARIYRGNARDLGYVQPGMYRLMFLLRDDQYFIKDSIRIKQAGINYYDAGTILPRAKDSTSTRISAIINNRESSWRSVYQTEDLDLIKHTFNDSYLDLSVYSRLIFGKVTDHKTGEPLAGVSIMVKGARVGTSTRPDGYFELRVPERATLEIAYIGYNTVSRKITDGSSYDIKLIAAEQSLSEVVVVGYGTQRKMSLTGSVVSASMDQALQGKAAGILIRGASSDGSDNLPLVLVDGLPYNGDWNAIDKNLIADISVLKSSEAEALFGQQAANGVIVITTTRQAAANAAVNGETAVPLPGNTLRRNFRDDAYWQPSLRTDGQGKTSFTATYPDDITNWRSFVIAMGSKKRTGFAEQSVRAFKALSGAIVLPQFAVAGDSVQVIGKTMNYGVDSITVRRSFSVNGVLVQEATIGLRNAYIDSFKVVIAQGDSSASNTPYRKETVILMARKEAFLFSNKGYRKPKVSLPHWRLIPALPFNRKPDWAT